MQMEFKGWVIPAAVGITSFAAGVAGGYFFARYRQKSIDVSGLATKEDISGLKEDVESQGIQLAFMFEERDRKSDLVLQRAERVSRDLKETSQIFSADDEPSLSASRDNHPSNGEKEDVASVFRVVDENWDYGVEVPKREANPNKPYILHRDEYFADEKGYDNQSTLTYYAGDNVLCDEQEVPIYNPEKVVGKLEFGHGSGDPNVVYVRNEGLEAEYEVLLDNGFFQVEVLGGQAEDAMKAPDLRHSVHKFRME